MLAWTIRAAVNSEKFDRVLVSTDDHEIAKIAESFGAEAPFLRTSAADDLATSSDATIVALSQAEEYWGEDYDVVAQLMANCPLRNAADVRNAVDNFHAAAAPSQISCFKFGWMNPWWSVKLDNCGRATPLFPEEIEIRSQDQPNLYCPTGAIWIAKVAELRIHQSFYSKNAIYFPMDWMSAMDIDDSEDLAMAEVCLELKQRAEGTKF